MQIVKVWIEDDGQREQVYDVACADGLEPVPETHRCPDNGATVLLETCDFDKNKGDTELRTRWRDPDFRADQHAFYYVQVLEDRTCRWSSGSSACASSATNCSDNSYSSFPAGSYHMGEV